MKRIHLALFAALALGACTTPSSEPPPAVEQHCNYHVLPDGQRICVFALPIGGRAEAAASTEGLRVEALLPDANFVGPLQSSVDLRSSTLDGCLEIRNQGECGWCVANAMGAALDALHCADGCPPSRVSMPHLWEVGHMGSIGDSCAEGWNLEPAFDVLSGSTPLVSESVWPYSGSPRSMNSSRPSDGDLAMGRYAATGYTMMTITNDDAQLETMKRAISSGRVLVVSSGVCFAGGWDSGAGTIGTTPPDCSSMGVRYDGYHAYTIVGYDDAAMEFIALNSWGPGWGEGGYTRISYDFARAELMDVGYLDQVNRDHGGCEMDPAMPEPDNAADRCAAHTTCDTCAATSGCVFCDGACVLADTARTGPASGTCTTTASNPSMCPAPSGACAMNADCGTCAAADGCAWCEGRNACVAWPSDFAACAAGGRVAVEPVECNDATRTCEMATDCGSCAAMDGCGWCPSATPNLHAGTPSFCFGGGTAGPDRVACPGMDWVAPGAMCPAPDAGMGSPDAGMDPDGGAPSDPCETVGTDCASCNAAAGCGFCGASNTCINDSRMGECSGQWRDAPFECTDCGALHSDCGSCMLDGNCGWCASSNSCMTANTGGGPAESCDDWHYVDVDYCS
jgi:hypothetical protein